MISRFFIDRPIFACVLSIVITLAGAIAVFTLPLAQFPPISPPNVSVACTYPGASAKDVAGSVAAPIEQHVNGVEGMLYMSSSCTNDGSYNLTVTFKHGVDLNMAQVLVQNRVSLALPLLPDVIKQTGVMVKKRAPDVLMGIAIISPDGRYDQLYLSNYAVTRIKDELARVAGRERHRHDGPARLQHSRLGRSRQVGRAQHDGRRRRARDSRAERAGRHRRDRQSADPRRPEFRDHADARSAASTSVEQFEDIIVKATPDGRIVRIKDIGRVELGAKNQDVSVVFDGKPTVFMPIFQLPDANALDTRDRVLAKMADLAQRFSRGRGLGDQLRHHALHARIDQRGVQGAARRDHPGGGRRAGVPAELAVVDHSAGRRAGGDHRHVRRHGRVRLQPEQPDAVRTGAGDRHRGRRRDRGGRGRRASHRERAWRRATPRSWPCEQVSGPVIAVGLVLSAVFVPCAFISGITGQFFRQFALTISVSTIISAFNSLTLSPALTALLLRPRGRQSRAAAALAGLCAGRRLVWLGQGREQVADLAVPGSALAETPALADGRGRGRGRRPGELADQRDLELGVSRVQSRASIWPAASTPG